MENTKVPRAYFGSIVLMTGLKIVLQPDSLVVFVGANNAGKTTALSELRSHLAESSDFKIITEVSLIRVDKSDDVVEYLKPYTTSSGQVIFLGNMFPVLAVANWWDRETSNIGGLVGTVLTNLTTRSRLMGCDPVNSVPATQPSQMSHPIHWLYRDDTLEKRVSDAFRRAFGQDLIVHKAAGSQVPLHVGQRPELNAGEDRTQLSYVERLEQLPTIEKQGDGMVSFASMLLNTKAMPRAIQLIDEPEAFLHPPQARLIAQFLVEDTNSQIFISTHSGDVLRGLVASNSERVSVIRLQRGAGGSRATHLSNERLQQFWGDSVLRYSNILEGLFHDGVVISEADGDCRFYDAVGKAIALTGDQLDLFYTYGGGKQRSPMIVRALRALEVEVRSIFDFDLLNDEVNMRNIVEAHGGEWLHFTEDWRAIKQAVERPKPI